MSAAIPREYRGEILTIRKVLNGWMVLVGGDYSQGGMGETLVFESLDSLLAGIQVYYNVEETEDESS